MKSVEMSNNETNISSPSLAFYCRYAPHVSWEDRGSAFQLISGLTLVMVSIPTIILNAFIILAEKQKKGATKTLKHFVVKPGRHRLSFSSFLLIFYWLLILLHVTCVSCYVTLLYVMLYYVTLCFVTLRYIMIVRGVFRHHKKCTEDRPSNCTSLLSKTRTGNQTAKII